MMSAPNIPYETFKTIYEHIVQSCIPPEYTIDWLETDLAANQHIIRYNYVGNDNNERVVGTSTDKFSSFDVQGLTKNRISSWELDPYGLYKNRVLQSYIDLLSKDMVMEIIDMITSPENVERFYVRHEVLVVGINWAGVPQSSSNAINVSAYYQKPRYGNAQANSTFYEYFDVYHSHNVNISDFSFSLVDMMAYITALEAPTYGSMLRTTGKLYRELLVKSVYGNPSIKNKDKINNLLEELNMESIGENDGE